MNTMQLVCVGLMAGVGSYLAVWGAVRSELKPLRERVNLAHERIDRLEVAA